MNSSGSIEPPPAEEALREKQAALEFALESARMGDWDLDLATDTARRSPRHDLCFGYTEPVPEWGLAKFIQHVHPLDRDWVERQFLDAVISLRKLHFECRIVWPDGTVHWIENHASVYHSVKGKATRMLGIVADITDRKRADARIRDSEERIRLAAKVAHFGIHDLDIETGKSVWSPEMYWIYGISPGSHIHPHTAGELVHPDDRSRVDTAMAAAVDPNGTGIFAEEFRIRRADSGEVRWVFKRSQTFFSAEVEGRKPLRRTGVVVDNTERKRAEGLVLTSQERYRTLFDSIDEGFCVVEVLFDDMDKPFDYRFLEVNPSFERHSGLSDALGRTALELVPGHENFWFEIYGKVAITGEPVRFQSRASVLGRWFDVYAVRFGNPEDRQVAIVFKDITGEKLAQEQMRESESRFRGTFDNAAVGMALVGLDGRLFRVNDTLCRITGRSREELLTQTLAGLTHPDDVATDSISRQKLLAGTINTYTIEKRFVRPDGECVWFSLTASMQRDAVGRPQNLIEVVSDVTDRKIAELELARVTADLEKANHHLEEVVAERTRDLREIIGQLETFSYSVTHDMRGPLRSMSAFAELLQIEFADKINETGQDYLRRIRDAATRLDRLIQDVLQFSQVSRTQLRIEPVDIVVLLSDILNQYPSLQAHREHVHVTAERLNMFVAANTAALTQVISNLLSNAVKFTEPGKCPEVHVDCRQEGDRIRLTVEDRGIGIPEEYHQKIFGVFERLHTNEYTGTGIGLSIVKKAVEKMGGTLGLQSKLGEGTRFWVELKAAAAVPSEQRTAKPDGTHTVSGGVRRAT